MPKRIIFHPGFHKTGTSSVQATLRENRPLMKDHIVLRRRWHMRELMSATRGYSTWRDPLTLIKVQDRFEQVMDGVPAMPEHTLIMSAEELCGHLPGRDDLMDYGAAPILLYAFWEVAQRRFPQAEILVYLTTRAPDAWLTSAYWEHVQSSDMTLDLDDFRDTYRKAANLGAVVDDITSRVPCKVHAIALEACKDLPHGPADPLLDLCDLPLSLRAELIQHPRANVRLDDAVLQALLKANRTHSEKDTLQAAKKAIMSEALSA
jgi:hypothetical protein